MDDYPGRYKTPTIDVKLELPPWEEWMERHREMRARQEAYRKTFRGRIEAFIYYWRGRLSDWIAPDGWNDE